MKVFNLGNMTTEQKSDMFSFFERKLVEQAVSQHLQNDEDLGLKGGVVGYELDQENECLLIEYKNGEVWQYRCIDCGADGMLYKLVKGGNE